MSHKSEPSEPHASIHGLGDNEVHIWLVDPSKVDDPNLLERYHRLLCPEEVERHDRFKFQRLRHDYLVARALVRTTLSRYVDVDPSAWRFDANRYGRPEIALPVLARHLRFNLSHTRGLATVAVVWERDLGVDVETIQRRNATVQIARRFFSPAEVAELESIPTESQHATFFNYWTLKEAYIKARGMGLAIPLEHFSFHLASAPPVAISFAPQLADDPIAWQFEQFVPSPVHRLAVAIRRRGDDLRVSVRTCVPLVSDR